MSGSFVAQEFTFTQPDGTTFEVVGTGNQFEAVFETPDGYTVTQNPDTGFYHFASLSADGTSLVPSGPVVGDAPVDAGRTQHLRPARAARVRRARSAHDAGGERRWEVRRRERLARQAAAGGANRDAPMPAAPAGDVRGLCLLIQFPDVPATIARTAVDDFCNLPGHTGFGNNGSVRDYFAATSAGRLRYTNIVTRYHTAAHNRAYYTDPTIPYGQRAQELIHEALNGLRAAAFDFSPLSADTGGNVFALNVFYAGPRVNNWSQGLWPHAWTLATRFDIGGGRRLADYQITDMGNQLTLRTFCHENGHMVCDFPDLYDYGGESAGVGNYCLMCYGGDDLNPVEINAALKLEAGWATSLRVAAPDTTYRLSASGNDFLVHRRSVSEFFVLENRNQSGRDSAIPDSGLAIWHVEVNGSNSNEQMTAADHYYISLEQADGRFDLERNANAGDGGDCYASPGPTAFSASTTPSSNWWDGTPSGFGVETGDDPGREHRRDDRRGCQPRGDQLRLQRRRLARGHAPAGDGRRHR